jgi:hypothetical protein
MDVAHAGPVQNEGVDATLAYPALQRARPLGERGLAFALWSHGAE